MEKLEVKTRLDLYTLEFYKYMIDDKKKREFYRIDYYLYFLKKENDNAFSEMYRKTKTGIIWPDNEKLMFKLICIDNRLLEVDYSFLSSEEKELSRQIYDMYKNHSLTKLKELVKDDINKLELFDSLTIDQQMSLIIKKYQELYQKNPQEAIKIISNSLMENNIIQPKHKTKKVIRLTKNVI